MNKKSTFKEIANDYLTHTEEKKGITLVALVVTIIVLIILAGTSISLVLGENGIITKSKEARVNSQSSEKIEKVRIAHMAALANGQGSYSKEELETELGKLFLASDSITVDEDTTNNEYVVKSNGTEIQRIKKITSTSVDMSTGLWYNSTKIADDGEIRSQLIFNKISENSANVEWNIGENIKISAVYEIETDAETGDSRSLVKQTTRQNTSTMETIAQLNGTLNGRTIELGQYLKRYLESKRLDEMYQLINSL